MYLTVSLKILAVVDLQISSTIFITDNKMTRVRQVTENVRFYRRFPVCAVSVSVGILTEYRPVLRIFRSDSARLLLKSRKLQTFGVLNIADQPLSYIKTGSLILIIAALAIPLLSWATQMLQPEAYATGKRRRMAINDNNVHGKFHEDDEHSNAAYVSIFLLSPSR